MKKAHKIRKILFRIFIGETAMRKLFSFYVYAILIGTILLCLPISLKNIHEYYNWTNQTTHVQYTVFDALYSAVSAFSDTGLSSVDIGATYNWFGQLVMAVLIQLGGLGLFTLYWMFWNVLFNNYLYKKRKGLPLYMPNRMNFRDAMIVSSERGNTKLGVTTDTVKTALIFIFITEGVFTLAFAACFALIPAYYQENLGTGINQTSLQKGIDLLSPSAQIEFQNFQNYTINGKTMLPTYHSWYALWAGLFQSVSAINNAGFDIIGVDSMAGYRNGIGTIFQILVILELMIGGLGYPVIYDIIQAIKHKQKGLPYKLGLFSKISLISYYMTSFVGMILMFGFSFGYKMSIINQMEFMANLKIPVIRDPNNAEETELHALEVLKSQAQQYFGTGAIKGWNQVNMVWFADANTRSAGFSCVNQQQICSPNKWVMIILMYIGCAPSSTGGGIRTTTLAVMLWVIVSQFKNYRQVVIFRRAIPHETVVQSFLIGLFGIFIIVIPSLIVYPLVSVVNPEISITDTMFEVASAFGTVGLSAGVSSTLTNYSAESIICCLILSLVMLIGQLGVPTALFTFKTPFNKNASIDFPTEDLKVS